MVATVGAQLKRARNNQTKNQCAKKGERTGRTSGRVNQIRNSSVRNRTRSMNAFWEGKKAKARALCRDEREKYGGGPQSCTTYVKRRKLRLA